MKIRISALSACILSAVTIINSIQTSVYAQGESRKYVNIVYPVRSRELWLDKSIENFEKIKKLTEDRNLAATWLLQYDVLFDTVLIDSAKSITNNNEIGAFLEVSEQLATDSRVAYKFGDGDYYRTDKVSLSGYSPSDREKLIETYFVKFKEVFKVEPKSVGAWYLDARSQTFLQEKGVIAALTVADQYDTDGASVWGKYYSMPFFPSKFNSLEPASSLQEKIPIVNTQWAQRDLVDGFGRNVKDSRQSFQANDYINNGFDFNIEAFFVNLDVFLPADK